MTGRRQIHRQWKKLPVEGDVPDFLVAAACISTATELIKAVGDLTLITFYYLLRGGKYMVKEKRPNPKQTQ